MASLVALLVMEVGVARVEEAVAAAQMALEAVPVAEVADVEAVTKITLVGTPRPHSLLSSVTRSHPSV